MIEEEWARPIAGPGASYQSLSTRMKIDLYARLSAACEAAGESLYDRARSVLEAYAETLPEVPPPRPRKKRRRR